MYFQEVKSRFLNWLCSVSKALTSPSSIVRKICSYRGSWDGTAVKAAANSGKGGNPFKALLQAPLAPHPLLALYQGI